MTITATTSRISNQVQRAVSHRTEVHQGWNCKKSACHRTAANLSLLMQAAWILVAKRASWNQVTNRKKMGSFWVKFSSKQARVPNYRARAYSQNSLKSLIGIIRSPKLRQPARNPKRKTKISHMRAKTSQQRAKITKKKRLKTLKLKLINCSTILTRTCLESRKSGRQGD